MIRWLRKVLRRDVTIIVNPVTVPPGHGVIFTMRDWISVENTERLRDAMNKAGFPESVVVAGVDHVYTIDMKDGAG